MFILKNHRLAVLILIKKKERKINKKKERKPPSPNEEKEHLLLLISVTFYFEATRIKRSPSKRSRAELIDSRDRSISC